MLKNLLDRDQDESGFTLIELLVVILIIGILSAIAVPVFLNQRNTANEASVKSDLKNAASVMETELASNKGVYPATMPASVKTSQGVDLSLVSGAKSLEDKEGWIYFTATPFFVGAKDDVKFGMRIKDGNFWGKTEVTPSMAKGVSVRWSAVISCEDGKVYSRNESFSMYEEPMYSSSCYPSKVASVSVAPFDEGYMKTFNGYRVNETQMIYPAGSGLNVMENLNGNQGFCLEGTHQNKKDNIWKYDSLNGGLSKGTCSS